jgi:hypothetical protein
MISFHFSTYFDIIFHIEMILNLNIKKLHLYITQEFLRSFFFGLTVFTILLILNHVFDLVDLFISKGVPLSLIIKLFEFSLRIWQIEKKGKIKI